MPLSMSISIAAEYFQSQMLLYTEAGLSTASAYIVIVQNQFFFVNIRKPIQTKFYTMTWTQMGRFPGNFGRPRSTAAKMAQKKLNFFSGRQRLRNAISQQLICTSINVAINPLGKELQNFSEKRSLTPKSRLFEVCFSRCLVVSLQTN